MKKLCCVLVGILMLTPIACFADASQTEEGEKAYTISFTVGQDKCKVNEQDRTIDENNSEVVPYISDETGQLMIPLRAFAECRELKVDWDESDPGAVDVNGGAFQLYIDEQAATRLAAWREVNSTQDALQKFDTSVRFLKNASSPSFGSRSIEDSVAYPPVAIYSEQKHDRIFVPARPLSEMFGFRVNWVEEKQTAVLEEIPDEELYTDEYQFEVVENRLKINHHRKNNTRYPIRWTLGSSTQYLIYNENGKQVWPSGGTGFATVITYSFEEGGKEYNNEKYSDELEPGRYYLDIKGSTWGTYCYIRTIKIEKPERFYFEIK